VRAVVHKLGDCAKAARFLGVSRNTVLAKLRADEKKSA
jgi:DNA-binding protein Fis